MSDKIKSLARVLVENSSDNVGIIQKNLVEDVLSGLREAKPPRHREILREYLLQVGNCLLYTSPSPRDGLLSRMPSSA